LIVFWVLRLPNPNRNDLAIGKAVTVDSLENEIQSPTDLDFLSKADVYQLRNEAVFKYPQLMLNGYTPSEVVFGQIVDGLPWWVMHGQFFYGKGEL
jgi:hypothetical protein